MILGFTGTRAGMTEQQFMAVETLIRSWSSNAIGLHGDCIGADVQFHEICRKYNMEVWKRPSNYTGTIAETDAKLIAEPKRPFARNRDIAHQCDRMIACPKEAVETKSGTWYTLTYTANLEKLVFVVIPNGQVLIRNVRVKA